MTPAGAPPMLRSRKLGDVPYSPDDVVRFADGLPGFEQLRDFLLVTRDECAPFIFLASLENLDVTLPLLPFAMASGGTALEAPADSRGRLGEGPGALIGAYAVVSIGPDAREITANLRAPVLVNLDTRRGCQAILPDETFPLQAPVGG